MAFRFWVSENISHPLTGGPAQITVDFHEDFTVDDLIWADAELPPPFVLIAPVQVEGTDFPIYTRQRIDDPEDWLFEAAWFDLFLPSSGDGSWPLTSIIPNPDETPLEFSYRHSTNQDEVIEDYRFQLLGEAGWYQEFSDWFLPFELGGTVYSDNLCRLMSEIQRHLLEHVIDNGLSWALWTREEVLQSVRQRVHRFLVETGLTRRRNTVAVAAGGDDFITIPEDVLQIRRMVWSDLNGKIILPKVDVWVLDNSNQGWEDEEGQPQVYMEQPLPSLLVRLFPKPDLDGVLEMSYVARPADFDNCDALPLPAMWVPYIKYGVLSDLLVKEGEANDPERALHFEQRWDEGIELGRSFLGTEV